MAKYVFVLNDKGVDSVIIDQNTNSGTWINLFRKNINAGAIVEVKVIDASDSITALVLRADAVRFLYVDTTAVSAGKSTFVPNDFVLEQNYPNPFNPTTTISYGIPVTGKVSITIYSALGQQIGLFDQGEQAPGRYSIVWSAAVCTGVYFYTLEVKPIASQNKFQRLTRKMLLIR
jgi:hypothetical protein